VALASSLLGDPSGGQGQNLSNIAATQQSSGVYNLATGQQGVAGAQPGQYNIADILKFLAGPTLAGGTTAGFDIQSLLRDLGLGTAVSGENIINQAVQMETTGQLPGGGAAMIEQNTRDAINTIKGKFASLGMSGSTQEAAAIANIQQQGMVNQFQLATQIGQTTGQLGGVLAQLGFGGLNTAGSLATTLGQLGIAGFGLSSSDLANIANEGLNQMQIGVSEVSGAGSVFQGLAQDTLAQDKELTDLLGSMFTAAGAAYGGGGIKVGSLFSGGAKAA